jgi:hypothetical protein
MGWNDHVEFCETECLECGEISTWQYWDSVSSERLNVNGKCPNCGSTGQPGGMSSVRSRTMNLFKGRKVSFVPACCLEEREDEPH